MLTQPLEYLLVLVSFYHRRDKAPGERGWRSFLQLTVGGYGSSCWGRQSRSMRWFVTLHPWWGSRRWTLLLSSLSPFHPVWDPRPLNDFHHAQLEWVFPFQWTQSEALSDVRRCVFSVSLGLIRVNYNFTTTRSPPGWQSGLTRAQCNMNPLALFSFAFILLLLIWTFFVLSWFPFCCLSHVGRVHNRSLNFLPVAFFSEHRSTGNARCTLFSSAPCVLKLNSSLHVCEEGTLAGSHLPSLYNLLILTLSLCLAIRVLVWL